MRSYRAVVKQGFVSTQTYVLRASGVREAAFKALRSYRGEWVVTRGNQPRVVSVVEIDETVVPS